MGDGRWETRRGIGKAVPRRVRASRYGRVTALPVPDLTRPHGVGDRHWTSGTIRDVFLPDSVWERLGGINRTVYVAGVPDYLVTRAVTPVSNDPIWASLGVLSYAMASIPEESEIVGARLVTYTAIVVLKQGNGHGGVSATSIIRPKLLVWGFVIRFASLGSWTTSRLWMHVSTSERPITVS